MLLHDSFFHSINTSISDNLFRPITIAYSPLFHSSFTLFLSTFGFIFNLICTIKLWLVLCQYHIRKLNQNHSTTSIHILAHHKYHFLLALTSNNILLCLSSVISCLDERYFSQTLLARYHLCAAEISVWKFTLHFIPLLIISILCRYHYILKRDFHVKPMNFSSLNQLLCTDLSILIPFVLSLAWSVDGLWLWGVANIKDFLMPLFENENRTNSTLEGDFSNSLTKLFAENKIDEYNSHLYLPEQTKICYLQTNHNMNFTVRLVHLIQADMLLIISLHLIAFFLEISLHIRLSCCVVIQRVTSRFNQERQLCIYILYIFLSITLTSLPFYFYRLTEIIFEGQSILNNNTFFNSRTFAQILLLGCCFKPLLVFLLFIPSSRLFKLECSFKCCSPVDIAILDQSSLTTSLFNEYGNRQETAVRPKCHYYSLFGRSSPLMRTTIKNINQRQNSVCKPEQYRSWLQLTNSFRKENTNNTGNIDVV